MKLAIPKFANAKDWSNRNSHLLLDGFNHFEKQRHNLLRLTFKHILDPANSLLGQAVLKLLVLTQWIMNQFSGSQPVFYFNESEWNKMLYFYLITHK